MKNFVTLIYKTHFDAAHCLEKYEGDCSRLHGHRWDIDIHINGTPDPETDMVMDFKVLKVIVDNHLPDHAYLNDLVSFNPTAENLAISLGETFRQVIPGFKKIIVWETPTTGVEYKTPVSVLLGKARDES